MTTTNIPRERKSQITKEKILSATARIAQENGYEYLTIRNICQEADVAYGSFYHHFGSKEQVLYEFCRGRLEETLALNPLPMEIDERNIIHTVLWDYLVYAAFCEAMGKGIIGCIYTQCENDLFEELCFEHSVIPRILAACEEGYLNVLSDRGDVSPFKAFDLMKRDMAVQLKGALFYWVIVKDKHTMQGLNYLLEGPINRFMLSWSTEKYKKEFMCSDLKLPTDLPWFENKIVIPFPKTAG